MPIFYIKKKIQRTKSFIDEKDNTKEMLNESHKLKDMLKHYD